MDIKDQLDAMLASGAETEPEPEPGQEQEVEPTSELEQEPELGAEEQTGDEGKDEEPDPLEELRTKNASLEAKLREFELTSQRVQPQSGSQQPSEPPQTIKFIPDDVDPYEIFSDREKANALLNELYRRGVTDGEERTLLRVPDVVKSNIIEQSNLKRMGDEFYRNNPDLNPFRRAVVAVAEDMQAQHPDWTVQKIFDEVGPETRRRLELAEQTPTSPQPTIVRKPRFAKVGGRARVGGPKPNTDPMLKEIDAMNAIE